jgi:elongation factor Ts
MSVSANLVKELREATGVGFLDCRKALEEANGDFDKAVELLRERGLAKAAKRAGREASEGVLELYNHGNGRVGVMLEVNCETDFVARSEQFREFAHEIALQIAAANPMWITEDEIPADILEREKEIARIRAREEGKPENILDRIVEGRIKKYIEEVVLMQQPYIRNEDLTIEDYLHETIAALGENIVIRRFARWEVGQKAN